MLDWHEECHRRLSDEIDTFINQNLGRLRLGVDNLSSTSTNSPPGSRNKLTATTLEGGRYINIHISAGTDGVTAWYLDILYDMRIERYVLYTQPIRDMFDLVERVRVTAECLVRTFLTEDVECNMWKWLDQQGEIIEQLSQPDIRLKFFTRIPHGGSMSGMLINSYNQ